MSKAICNICPRHCALENGETGYCRGRKNINGKVVPINYGKITNLALDPIEKKPISRYMEGSKILSIGTFGCNFRCPFCFNSDISMKGEDTEWTRYSVDTLVRLAEKMKIYGNIGIAYTYNEPLTAFEFVRDTAIKVKEYGMKNILVTNGNVTKDIADSILPLMDAVNIDLKAFNKETYKNILKGDLEAVKYTIKKAYEETHLEITTLIVPGMNDTDEEIDNLTSWLGNIDQNIPFHISRFFPCYKYADREPTPLDTLYRLMEVAKRNLNNVIPGNFS